MECATDFAASSAALNLSGVAMSGLGAPRRTAIPTKERVRSVRAGILPCAIRSSIAAAVNTAASPVSPAAMRFIAATEES